MVAKYNSSSHLSPRKLENEKGFRDGPTTLAVPLAQRSPFLFSQLAHLPSLIINDHRRIHRSSPRSDSFHHCLVFFNVLHCTASDLLVSFRAACCFSLCHVIRVHPLYFPYGPYLCGQEMRLQNFCATRLQGDHQRPPKYE